MINTQPCPFYQGLDNYWQEQTIPCIYRRANTETNWSDTDSEENFNLNPKPGYTKNSIVYQYNSNGYRSMEFDLTNSKPSILCLGCSFTEGVGVNYNETWVSKIADYFPEYNTYNLGVGGSSGDTVARTLYSIGNMLDTKIVFILWPHITRYELYNPGAPTDELANSKFSFNRDLASDTHAFNLREKNKAIVKLLSRTYNFHVEEEFVDNIIHHNGNSLKLLDTGRDTHPGPQWHNAMAQLFIKRYNDNSKI